MSIHLQLQLMSIDLWSEFLAHDQCSDKHTSTECTCFNPNSCYNQFFVKFLIILKLRQWSMTRDKATGVNSTDKKFYTLLHTSHTLTLTNNDVGIYINVCVHNTVCIHTHNGVYMFIYTCTCVQTYKYIYTIHATH